MNTKLIYIKNWKELAQRANWSASKLARLCNVSARTLERHFSKKMGQSPKLWLARQRQTQAVEILLDGSSVKEVAATLGYKHPTHFSRGFKAFWGCCPTTKQMSQQLEARQRRDSV